MTLAELQHLCFCGHVLRMDGGLMREKRGSPHFQRNGGVGTTNTGHFSFISNLHLQSSNIRLSKKTRICHIFIIKLSYPIYHDSICTARPEASVVKSHHKFMLASYMMQIAKFLAILHHNASFYNFCFIINLFHCLIFSKY